MRSKITKKRVLGLTLAAALAVTGTIAFASSSQAAAGKVVITPTSGPEATAGKVITLTGTGFKVGSVTKVGTVANSGVQFNTATTCPATSAAADATAIFDATTRSVVSATKLVVTVPALTAAVAPVTTQKWSVCVYDTASPNVLLSSGSYSTLPAPVLTSLSPASGSNAGGDTVTVVGTGFTKTSKVKFGTVASTKVTVSTDGTTITAVTPSEAAATTVVSVTTEGGTNAPVVGSADEFSFKNAITLSPVSGDGTAGNTIDITGVGFSALAATPSVVFTRAGMTSATDDIATCSDVQLVSDTELICTAPDLTSTNGAFVVVVTSDATKYMADATVANRPDFETVLSSGAAYISAPF